MRHIRDKRFAGFYSNAGRVYLLDGIAALGAITLTFCLLILIFKALIEFVGE